LRKRAGGAIFQPMMDSSEDRLIEALKNVDAHGDVAPAHVHDPMTMVLRENAIKGNLVRWDDERYRYVLTGSGRRRISTRGRGPGAVLTFRKRDDGSRRKPPKALGEE
jgi:hypothetical protein